MTALRKSTARSRRYLTAGLTEQQKVELRELVIKGPDPATDHVVRWRCVDLKAVVARRFSVEVHEITIGKWLNQLGLTRLQPRSYHPKKDAEAEATFKKQARVAGPPVALETGRASLNSRGSGRKVFGGFNPVKKRGPWAVADLRVVTPSGDPD
jgi:transposase